MDSGNGTDFPRRFALTRRFSLGVPTGFTISPGGERVVFLRSGGRDPVTRLWALDVETGTERLIADPDVLLAGAADEPPAEERARRERTGERGDGITSYATDRAVRRAVFALSGRLWLADLTAGEASGGNVTEVPVPGPVVDPRLDPAGNLIAFVRAGAVWVAGVDGSAERVLAASADPQITYGLPEYVAAAEMGRVRGFWWAPDGSGLLVARVDLTRVRRWYLADPANPQKPPEEIAYPLAGTPNAEVSLQLIGLDTTRTEVNWDRAAFEYLVSVAWDPGHDPLLAVQSRDQRTARVLRVSPAGGTEVLREDRDADWVDIGPGVPAMTAAGELVWLADIDGSRRLLRDGRPVTPPGTQVREVVGVDGDTVVVTASQDPMETHLWSHCPRAGLVRHTDLPGLHGGRRAGGVTVVTSRSLEHDGTRVHVHRAGEAPVPIAGHAEPLGITLRLSLLRAGPDRLRTAVLFPSWHEPGSGPLPVLMDPYAGYGLQLVVRARGWPFGVSQWFAEQGFAVVVADGRGTPGRGPGWERAIRGDKAGPVLADQVTALHAAAERYRDLDLSRVGIRGWSFGGFLAALAVLRRPDVFHAAVAGAPPSDQRLYNTYWNERLLGHPDEEPENYERSSLVPEAARLRRPLMLVQGMADDNVFPVHTLRLSSALLAAGRPHTVLPLSGVTHNLGRAAATENMLRLQLDFLRRSLAVPEPRPPA